MTNRVLKFGGLLVVAYGVLLFLKASDARMGDGEAPTTIARPVLSTKSVTAERATEAETFVAVAGQEPAPVTTEAPPPGESEEPTVQELPPAVPELTQRGRAIRELAYSSTPQAVEAVTLALRTDPDRRDRLAAVDSLLLMGRKASVDPAIRRALLDATDDADRIVAQQARAALTEVEHCEGSSE